MFKLSTLLAALGAVAFGQLQLDDGCTAFTSCMEEVQTELDHCSSLTDSVDMELLERIMPQQKKDQLTCMEEVKAQKEIKKALNLERDAEYKVCLARRSTDSRGLAGLGANKEQNCRELLDDFGAASARVKRNANRAARRAANRALRQEMRASGRLDDWKAAKTAKKQLKNCKRAAKQLKKSCKPLTKCCSEAPLCHLEYELSNTHDGIKRAQLAIIEQKRKCGEDDDLEEVSADQIVENQLPGGDD